MRNRRSIRKHLAIAAGLTYGVMGLASPAAAQMSTTIFTFDDVRVDLGVAGGETYPVTGTFEWTYTPGDFENGTGVFSELSFPGESVTIAELDITIEPAQIEFSLAANLHDEGLDVTLRLLQDFSTSQSVLVDTASSSYQVEHGTITTGTFVSGSVDPQADITSLCFGDGSGAACPCGNGGAVGEGCVNSAGRGAVLAASGSTSVAADDLAFQMVQGPGPSPALLFVGTQQVSGGSGIAFGDGLRCAGGSIRRLSVQVLDASGSASWAAGLAARGEWTAGDVRVFQSWYRDVLGSPCGAQFNTSQALAVVFQP